MGAETYEIPAVEGLVAGTAIKTAFKEPVFNEETKKWEEVERSSKLGEYKGGNLLGWSLYGKERSKILLYDNAKEAKGKNYGYITINEHESVRDWFPTGIRFNNAIFYKPIEGKVEGVVFIDSE